MIQEERRFRPTWIWEPACIELGGAISIPAIERQDGTVVIDQKRRQPSRAYPELEYVGSMDLSGRRSGQVACTTPPLEPIFKLSIQRLKPSSRRVGHQRTAFSR